jgi:hypothetical protein
VFPQAARCGLISECLGQVGQQVVAQHLFRFETVVFAGDDDDGDLDRAGLAGDVPS